MVLIMRAAVLSGIGVLSYPHTLQYLSMRNSYKLRSLAYVGLEFIFVLFNDFLEVTKVKPKRRYEQP